MDEGDCIRRPEGILMAVDTVVQRGSWVISLLRKSLYNCLYTCFWGRRKCGNLIAPFAECPLLTSMHLALPTILHIS